MKKALEHFGLIYDAGNGDDTSMHLKPIEEFHIEDLWAYSQKRGTLWKNGQYYRL